MKKVIGYILILAGLLVLATVYYFNSELSTTTRTFSSYTLLRASWEKYKQVFINQDGRVIDHSQNDITTSEGQSYAMLRAVWIDDKEMFDKVWKWTKENLKRPNDNLLGWKWGQRQDGSYGFMEGGGDNSASDAESDIALALIMASYRWSDPKYADEARVILKDLWELNTGTANDKRYLVAGNWAQTEQELTINPSYFAPYAWRVFAEVDKEHNWNGLIDPGYELLFQVSEKPLDKERACGLAPDWVVVNRQSGEVRAPSLTNLTTNYSYDAIRVPWRVALDYAWNKEARAYDYLKNNFDALETMYTSQGKLVSSYGHDCTPLNEIENPSMYATALGYFKTVHPALSVKIYEEKIVRLYSNDKNSFNDDLPYYDQNWLWFGAGLQNDALGKFVR